MKKFILLLLTGSTLLFANSLQWQNTMPVKSDKPLMVFVEKSGCPWCQKMKNNTFKDDKVINALQAYTPVRMSIKRWNRLGFEQVNSVPAIFFFDRDKTQVHKTSGYWEPMDFLFDIKKASQKLDLKE
ncbi:MAG: thioredoxin fold domain-containing protein [Campylobacterota bacterium]